MELTSDQWIIVLAVGCAALTGLVGIFVAKGWISEATGKRLVSMLKAAKEAGSGGAAGIIADLKDNKLGDSPAIVGKIDDLVKDVKGKKKRSVGKRIGGLLKAIVMRKLLG